MFVNCFLAFLTLALKIYQKHIYFKCNSSKLCRYLKFVQYFCCSSISFLYFVFFCFSAFCFSQCFFSIITQTKRSSFHNCKFIVKQSETAQKQFSFGHTPVSHKIWKFPTKKSFFMRKIGIFRSPHVSPMYCYFHLAFIPSVAS